MRRALPIITGLLLVVAVVLLSVAWREIGLLRAEVARLRDERASTESRRAASPIKGSPLTAKAGVAAAKAGAKEDDRKESNEEEKADEGSDLLMGAGKKDIQQRSDARVALLAERLNLRPDQVDALKKHGAQRVEDIYAAFERITGGTAGPPDLGVLIDWFSGRLDLPVSGLLDADQAKAFASFETEDRTSRIENLVSMELMELHGEAGIQLTAEQKDQVFDKIGEITTDEDAMGDAYYVDDGQFDARIAESLRRRKEALRPILTDAQMQNYDRMLEADGKMIAEKFSSRTEVNAADANGQR